MATFKSPKEVLEVLSAPLGSLIASVGRSVAAAQEAMDQETIDNFRAIYQEGSSQAFAELRSIGYRPTWYMIPEVNAEISVALTLSGQQHDRQTQRRGALGLLAAPVDAGYASKFNYTTNAASSLKFKIVPVPASSAASAMTIAPKLIDRTIAEARSLLDDLGIGYAITDGTADDAIVAVQRPAPGEIIPTGILVELEI